MNAPPLDTDALPTDIPTLHTLVRELRSMLRVSEARCEKLDYKLRDLIRRMFGAKNEKLNDAQRLLFGILSDAIDPAPEPPATLQKSKSAGSKKAGGGRRPKPENLPVCEARSSICPTSRRRD
jgi:hypothetical protein